MVLSRITWCLEGMSHYATMWIGVRYGHQFPMHFVCGYPRSGTTWFSELLADYLNLPRPRHYRLPLAFACVVHTHVSPSFPLDDCFYVIRDGRDAAVSRYFQLMKMLEGDGKFAQRSKYLRLFPNGSDDTKRNLPAYVEYLFRQRKAHWGEHVSGWLRKARQNSERIVIVRYEDLLRDPFGAFVEVLRAKYGDVDTDLARSAVDRQQFDRQKRRPTEQHRTYLRIGRAGDWRNWFTPECAELFDAHAGEALIEAGYEHNHEWVTEFGKGKDDHRD